MKIIAYYRVSTKQQGESGLGLEGQVATVAAYARGQGAAILRAYREVESGKRADRPELAKALAHARRSRATLVIAKLDRLARNVHFLSGLMESNVDFIACDNPHANKLTIHILAAVAEDEAKRISERTRAALAAYKGPAAGSGRRGRRAAGSPRSSAPRAGRGPARSSGPRSRRRTPTWPASWPSCGPRGCRCAPSPRGSTPTGTPPAAASPGTPCRSPGSSGGPAGEDLAFCVG